MSIYNHNNHLHMINKPATFGAKKLDTENILINGISIIENAFNLINTKRLFQVGFGYSAKNADKAEYEVLIKNTVYPKYESMKENIIKNKLIKPVMLYGYFPTITNLENDKLYAITENDEKIHIPLDRMKDSSNKSIVDFYEPSADFLGFTLVSAGVEYNDFIKSLYENDEYKDYYFYHALGTQLTDHFVDILESYMCDELKIKNYEENKNIGCRYSFGYKALSDLYGNKIIYDFLNAKNENIILSESFMFEPELTTAAIVSFCEEAHYFSS